MKQANPKTLKWSLQLKCIKQLYHIFEMFIKSPLHRKLVGDLLVGFRAMSHYTLAQIKIQPSELKCIQRLLASWVSPFRVHKRQGSWTVLGLETSRVNCMVITYKRWKKSLFSGLFHCFLTYSRNNTQPESCQTNDTGATLGTGWTAKHSLLCQQFSNKLPKKNRILCLNHH